MKWQGRRESENVEDRRSARAGLPGIPIPLGRGGIGLGGLAIVFILGLALGIDPIALLQGLTTGQGPGAAIEQQAGSEPVPDTPEMQELKSFVSVVLADTEDAWHGIFQTMGRTYEEPKLVLFNGTVESACGLGQSAMGPFYCPGDQRVYIDLAFYQELKTRFGAPGDFAQAYVIAHEVGHHVQNLLGISAKVQQARQRMSEADANALSVRTELQADCYAGLWAQNADRMRGLLEQGDVEEALNAASAIGDDTLQRETRGYVVPESFTHGSSAQRVRWFKTGFAAKSIDACDTFNANPL